MNNERIQVEYLDVFNDLNTDNLNTITSNTITSNTNNLNAVNVYTNNIIGDQVNIQTGLSINSNLLYYSNPSGYLTGIGYTGNYDGGYFHGKTKLSQNTIRLIDNNFGNNFIAKLASSSFTSIGMSADGKYQTALAVNSPIYVSNDYGNTWNATSTPSDKLWNRVVVSSNGKYQIANTNQLNQLYISKDYGNTWTPKDSNRYWGGISINSDGKYMVALVGSYVYVSNDYGDTWNIKTFLNGNFISISNDAKYQTLVQYGSSGKIYISKNYGVSWSELGNSNFSDNISSRYWRGISISSDGQYQTCIADTAGIYVSSDYGKNWTLKVSSAVKLFTSISISSDGKYQVAAVNNGKIHTSNDYGNTWTEKTEGNKDWNSVSVSSDGKYITASAVNGGGLYVSKTDELVDGNLYVDNLYSNNLVYNTGQILNTTYSTLTGLKAASGLLSGQLYRISDFVLKWNNQSINDQTVKTAASGEPLIVTALSNNKIYHIAQSETYPQDTIYYNIDASGSYSWGNINNTAAIPNFKGWIYRRVDNLLNIDIPYDWRNITVNCCKPNVSSVPHYSGNYAYNKFDVVIQTGNTLSIPRGKLYYSVTTGNSGNALNNENFWNQVSSFVESGTYFSTDENYDEYGLFNALYLFDVIADEYLYKINLPADTGSRIQQPTFTSILTGLGTFTLNDVYNIKIEGGYNNVIQGSSFNNNTIGNNFSLNTTSSIFRNNVIGDSFSANFIGSIFDSNTIANNFANNIIGSEFIFNTIESNFSSNTIGYYFRYNTTQLSFGSNAIGNIFQSNAIGRYFFLNTIGNSFDNNDIGNFFQGNNIRNNFQRNTSENNVNNIDFLTSTHVYSGYNKTLFNNSAGTLRLRYFNSSDQLVVTDPTA